MPKINWAYLKKPSVIIGAVVLFFVLLFLLNRSGGTGSSASTVVNAGPSDAQVAANAQLALAQLQAGVQQNAIQVDYAKSQDTNATQIALAQIAATLQGQSLVVQQNIAAQTIAAQTHGMDLQYQGLVNQNATALAAAKAQYQYGLASQTINSTTMLQIQKMSTDANLVMALAGKNKYSSIALPAYFGTAPVNYSSGQSGTSILNVVSPISNLF